MKFTTLTVFLFVTLFSSINAQENLFFYEFELNSGLSSEDELPFWMTANQYGKIPNSDYALSTISFGKEFNKNNTFQYAFKGSVTGSFSNENETIINELYTSLKYKKVRLDIGSKNNSIVFEGLSTSNGNFTESTNSRAIPGYEFSTLGFLKLPFAKNWLTFKATYGDYLMNDTRYVDNTLLHKKSLHFKAKLNHKFDLIAGLNHYAQWNGTSLSRGDQPSGFKNYIKTVLGSAGGSDTSFGDQANALGNHLGSYLVQLNSKSEKTNWSAYISHPFEDRSGRELANYPDNIYGFFIDFKKEKALITHAVAEITYTKHRSGDSPHYYDEDGVYQAGSGKDQYFNNYIYESGWTYFGDVIGSPYIIANTIDENEMTLGTNLDINRFVAYHLGIQGYLGNIRYKTAIDYVNYDHWFDANTHQNNHQFLSYIELSPNLKNLPFAVSFGGAANLGNLTTTNFGGFIKLSKRGNF